MIANFERPECLSDAPAEVMLIANHLAKALANALRKSIPEAIPEIMDKELNDLAKGVCLLAAQKFKQ